MHNTTFRRVGGSIMMTVPPAFIEQLNIQHGDQGSVAIRNGKLVTTPVNAAPKCRSKYKLSELLDNTEYPLAPCDRVWIDAPAAGREIL